MATSIEVNILRVFIDEGVSLDAKRGRQHAAGAFTGDLGQRVGAQRIAMPLDAMQRMYGPAVGSTAKPINR